MVKSFFIGRVALICTFMFAVGCSSDSTINDNEIEEINVKRPRPLISLDETMEILIEYVEGTPEETKKTIRQIYSKSGLLLRLEKCEVEDIEVWTANPQYRGKPKLHESMFEAIKRITPNASCEDYFTIGRD